jgi:hypothetical protein
MLLALALSLPLALPSARAEPAPQISISVVGVNPPAGAEGVPVDTKPSIGFDVTVQSEVTVSVVAVESGDTLSIETLMLDPGMRLVTIEPGAGFAAETAYELVVSSAVIGDVVVGFTTGTDVAVEVPAPELLTDETRTLTYDGAASSGALDVSVDADAIFPAIVVVRDVATGDIVGITLPPAGPGQVSVWVEATADAKPDEVCLQATGVDGGRRDGDRVCTRVGAAAVVGRRRSRGAPLQLGGTGVATAGTGCFGSTAATSITAPSTVRRPLRRFSTDTCSPWPCWVSACSIVTSKGARP